jgi:hypothetical protein
MEAVKRNANSKEIVACTAVYIFPDNDDHMIYEMCKAFRICLDWDPYDMA